MPKKTPPRTSKGPNRNLLIALGAAVVVVAAIVVGVLAFGGGGGGSGVDATSSSYIDGIPQSRDVLGDPAATVTMIQFEDLQCPVCQRYTAEAQQDVVTEYVKPGKVKLRFVGLGFIGEDSQKALRYALAAGKQNKLWQFAELLYQEQGPENTGWVTDGLLEDVATALKLDWARLKTDAASAAVTQQANSMSQEGVQRNVTGTPSFFIQVDNKQPYQVQPTEFSIAAFRPIFDDALGSSQ
jgi:protein-disulfide isomerase